MYKKSLIYLLISIVVVVLAKYIDMCLIYLDLAYTYINVQLNSVFSPSPTGIFIRKVVTLSVLPVAIAAIPSLIYRLIKGKVMPYFFELVWGLWLILVLSKLLY